VLGVPVLPVLPVAPVVPVLPVAPCGPAGPVDEQALIASAISDAASSVEIFMEFPQ